MRVFLATLLSIIAAAAPAQDDAPRAAIAAFAARMAEAHGFDAAQLERLLAIAPNRVVLEAIVPANTAERQSWQRYRRRFINAQHIALGKRFLARHDELLGAAEARFGVPAEIVAAIIGVETAFGRSPGRLSVLESLTTLAFHYPPRAAFFQRELEAFLLYTRDAGIPPGEPRGSFAGAIGLPQFMPSSIRAYAIDFDGDGRVDLQRNAADAIGSVAAFLSRHGWQAGTPVAVVAGLGDAPPQEWLDAGVKPSLDAATLGKEAPAELGDTRVALLALRSPEAADEYWWGFENFYVLTRYNRSTSYAMAVTLLAETLAATRRVAAPVTTPAGTRAAPPAAAPAAEPPPETPPTADFRAIRRPGE